MLHPLNDYAKVQIDMDEFGFGGSPGDKAQSGILISLPDKFNYFGFFSFAFERSFGNEEELKKLYNYYKQLTGRRVYWLALSEKGAILKQNGKNYAFIKLTSIIAHDEDVENIAENVLDNNGGAFSV